MAKSQPQKTTSHGSLQLRQSPHRYVTFMERTPDLDVDAPFIVPYDKVILDSGASDHMHSSVNNLYDTHDA